MFTRRRALLTLALALAACSSKSPLVGPTYAKAKAQAKPGAALVYVYRYAAEPTDAPATLLLDGEELVGLTDRAFTWFHAPPGAHRLAVRWPPVSGQRPAEIGLEVEAGGAYFVELTGVHRTTGHGVAIASALHPRPRDVAEPKLQACGLQPPAPAAGE